VCSVATNKGIEAGAGSRYVLLVKTARKPRRKTEAELLDHATNNLLSALKKDMRAKEGHVDYDKLRKEGYSERLLQRFEES
jgi:hypothetical protein